MMPSAWAAGLLLLLAVAPGPAAGADVVEGKDAVFAERGVVVLWAILKGTDDSRSAVVVRVLALDGAAAAYAVEGVNPKTGARRALLAAKVLDGWEEVRLSPATLAELPRTELHFAGRLEDSMAGRHALTVFFAGVPATTPEVGSEGALSAYFAGALNRARHRPAAAPR